MTHGSLYSQFGSKERLVEEALEYAIATSGRTAAGTATLGQYISDYLSTEHRDKPGHGCPLAALVCEMPRQSDGVRERFTATSGHDQAIERPHGSWPEATTA